MSTNTNSKTAEVTDLLGVLSRIVDIERRLRVRAIDSATATKQLDGLADEVTERWPDTFNADFRAQYFGAAGKAVAEKTAAPDATTSATSPLEKLAELLRPRAQEVSASVSRPSSSCRSVADAESLLRKKLAASRNPITPQAKRRISVFISVYTEQADLFSDSRYSGTAQLLVSDAYGNVHDVGALFSVVTGGEPLSDLNGLSNTTRLRFELSARPGLSHDDLAALAIEYLRVSVLDEALAKLYPGEPSEATSVLAVIQ